jgi:hypothetical protein
MGLKGTRFTVAEDIKSNATAELQKIPKEAFRRGLQQWQDRWSKCSFFFVIKTQFICNL